MFGYLRPYKPEMKMKDFAAYKAVYCGLCRTLGKRYGFFSRMILSYDATILSILCMSLQEKEVCTKKCFCPANIVKKCNAAVNSTVTDFWADVSVLLFFYKVKDNIKDGSVKNKLASMLILPFAKHYFKKAVKYNNFAYEICEEYIKNQSKLEKDNCPSVDKSADPTAKLLSKFLVSFANDENEVRILERTGYFIGRFIYLCDAVEDLLKDKEDKSYNPFIYAKISNGETLKGFQTQLLNSCIYEVNTALDLITLKRGKDIVINAFYLGMPQMKKAVLSGLSKKEKKEQFKDLYKI